MDMDIEQRAALAKRATSEIGTPVSVLSGQKSYLDHDVALVVGATGYRPERARALTQKREKNTRNRCWDLECLSGCS